METVLCGVDSFLVDPLPVFLTGSPGVMKGFFDLTPDVLGAPGCSLLFPMNGF